VKEKVFVFVVCPYLGIDLFLWKVLIVVREIWGLSGLPKNELAEWLMLEEGQLMEELEEDDDLLNI